MEKAANPATARALQMASETFITVLSSVTMADLAEDFEKRLAELGLSKDSLVHKGPHTH